MVFRLLLGLSELSHPSAVVALCTVSLCSAGGRDANELLLSNTRSKPCLPLLNLLRTQGSHPYVLLVFLLVSQLL